MESSVSQICQVLSKPATKFPPFQAIPIQTHQNPHKFNPNYTKIFDTQNLNLNLSSRKRGMKMVECGKSSRLMGELEREMGEWREMDRCKGTGEMEELMECLEREAIMGDDEGREPFDYNRRAQIFDWSSKVFQALKEHTQQNVSCESSKNLT